MKDRWSETHMPAGANLPSWVHALGLRNSTAGQVWLAVIHLYREGEKRFREEPAGTVLRGPAGTHAASGAVVFA